jgi:hypothetical protein
VWVPCSKAGDQGHESQILKSDFYDDTDFFGVFTSPAIIS